MQAAAWTENREYDVLAIGEVNIDLIMSGLPHLPGFGEEVLAEHLTRRLGGSTANFAVCCARLGLRVAFVARVGRDDFGDFLIEQLESMDVGSQHITRDPSLRTGLTVSLSGAEDRAFVTYVGTIDSLTGDDVPDHLLRACRHVHVGSYFLQTRLQPALPGIFRRAHAAGASVALDTGFDPAEKWDSGVRELLEEVDLLFPNEIEAPAIAGADDELVAMGALSRRCGVVALKLGERGAMACEGSRCERAPACEVQVADTTCCGDAFDAGFTSALLAGRELGDCLRRGNACGSLMASVVGNDVSVLTPAAVSECESACEATPAEIGEAR
ncbi:MAG TPA: carbohydrate kinase family protein [Armatimonadota bacterium]|nr:carbohydrate kinase family protein [Armatimonadota bacterium]